MKKLLAIILLLGVMVGCKKSDITSSEHGVNISFNSGNKTSTYVNNNPITLKDAFEWGDKLKVEDITKVKVANVPIGVAPYNLRHDFISEEKEDIEKVYTILSSKLKKIDGNDIEGGSAQEYTFYVNEKEYKVASDNDIIKIGKGYYVISYPEITISNKAKEYCSFIRATSQFVVLDTSTDMVVKSLAGLDTLVFEFYGRGTMNANYYIVTRASYDIYVVDEKTIYFNDGSGNKIYKIVSESIFKSLFQ